MIEVEHLPQVSRVVSPPRGEPTAEAPLDMKSLERAHIMEALDAVNGSRKLAAQRLGMSERTLRYKLQQYREESAASGQAAR